MQTDGRGRPPNGGGDMPILDPREAQRRDRQGREPSAGLEYLRTIAAEERQWMEKMVVNVAARFNVDCDDLLQDLKASLLNDDSFDVGRTGHRKWLTQRAVWKAKDLRRIATRHEAEPLESTPEPPAPEPKRFDADWDVKPEWRLSRNEAQIVRLIGWGADYSMRELSELLDRKYDSIRQDKCRAFRKIEKLIGLTPDELVAFLAYRRSPSYAGVAIQLGLSEEELRARIRRAEDKIRLVLGRSVTDDSEEGGGSDAS
jgi:DNA-directed RNA polymerase specialized sigma24 family protein